MAFDHKIKWAVTNEPTVSGLSISSKTMTPGTVTSIDGAGIDSADTANNVASEEVHLDNIAGTSYSRQHQPNI